MNASHYKQRFQQQRSTLKRKKVLFHFLAKMQHVNSLFKVLQHLFNVVLMQKKT